MDEKKGNTYRGVMLWVNCRSLSTVFLKCMSYVKGIQVVSEPYMAATMFGPERTVTASGENLLTDISGSFKEYKTSETSVCDTNLKMAVEDEVCTFDWVKETLEATYTNKDIVFAKDMGFSVVGKYDKLPSGFRHTYLIRHPHKVFLSWKKFAAGVLETPYESFVLSDKIHPTLFPPKRSYGELYDLMMFLKNRGDEPMPIVIDADDLQQDPDSILSQYFASLGIPYDKSLLHWPSGVDGLDNWIGARTDLSAGIKPGGYFETALVTSSCFAPPSAIPTRDQLDADILAQVDFVWRWYEEMYALRIRP
ncbi:uncharacterized protein [Amphiura filiformis]|uniref:uncharacterized protein n=1 Tax=Amphiura filiformis TaxID=82378 RepID=UPI003B2180E0